MITFKNDNPSEPFVKLKKAYKFALENKQSEIQAILIASYSKEYEYVDARYVNLKIIDNDNFIFFSNYNSPKSKQFKSHDQISAVLYWQSINTQIRMKANISKTSKSFSDQYFAKRAKEKNALAISSDQSRKIKDYKKVKQNFYDALKNSILNERPEYWGGYRFKPYYFEFWEGHEMRLNKRVSYERDNENWIKSCLQP